MKEKQSDSLSKSSIYAKEPHLEIDTEHISTHFRTLSNLDEQFFKNRASKSFGVNSGIPAPISS